ncbi:MAG: 16S rRNA (guanine(527)-N(7))-methyltransferase RsmG [Paracoccaceae bacterium]
MSQDRGRAEFCEKINVSRETLAMLDVHAGLLEKWSAAINLVSKSTLPTLWARHFLDSAQIYRLADTNSGKWLDIGTGGGFPGLVVAIMAQQDSPGLKFTFIESDQRKSAFLRTVIRELSLDIPVLSQRIEEIEPLMADILSTRALAPLSTLLGYAETHLKPAGQALFMKGASFRRELDEALEFWSFQSDEYNSITDGDAVILSLGDIQRV